MATIALLARTGPENRFRATRDIHNILIIRGLRTRPPDNGPNVKKFCPNWRNTCSWSTAIEAQRAANHNICEPHEPAVAPDHTVLPYQIKSLPCKATRVCYSYRNRPHFVNSTLGSISNPGKGRANSGGPSPAGWRAAQPWAILDAAFCWRRCKSVDSSLPPDFRIRGADSMLRGSKGLRSRSV